MPILFRYRCISVKYFIEMYGINLVGFMLLIKIGDMNNKHPGDNFVLQFAFTPGEMDNLIDRYKVSVREMCCYGEGQKYLTERSVG